MVCGGEGLCNRGGVRGGVGVWLASCLVESSCSPPQATVA